MPPARIVFDPEIHGSLEEAVERAPPGAVIAVPAGEWPVMLELGKDVAIEGAGAQATVLSRAGKAPIVHVTGDRANVRLSGLTLRGGRVNQGGALRIAAKASVEVEDCVFDGNRGAKGGGAIHALAGDLVVRRTLFRGNSGALGGAILADRRSTVTLEDATLQENAADAGGGILARGAARVRLLRTSVRRNTAKEGGSALAAWGEALEAPTIDIEGGALAGPAPAVLLAPAPKSRAVIKFRAKGAALPAELENAAGVEDAGGNRFAG